MGLKPVETRYKGYRMRSRTEARWGVFFDAMGIEWEYEKEGYDIGGMWYLPDFWLPQMDCFFEVKGEAARAKHALILDPETFYKAARLTALTGKRTLVFAGPCWYTTRGTCFSPCTEQDHPPFEMIFKFLDFQEFASDPEIDDDLIETMQSGPIASEVLVEKSRHWAAWKTSSGAVFGVLEDNVCWTSPASMVLDEATRRVWMGPGPFIWGLPDGWAHSGESQEGPTFEQAFIQARSARFEHGEKG